MAAIDAAQVQSWQQDICAWAEECVVIRDPSGKVGPVKLFPHQRAFLEEASRRDGQGNLVHKYVAACWSKRGGKGLVVSLLLAHRLFLFAETQSYILSNSERQSISILLERVKEIAKRSPKLKAMRPRIATRKVTVPSLGSSIEALPNNASTCQGLSIGPNSIFASDEIHAAQVADPDAAFIYLAAQCEADNALIAISSQAGPPLDSNPMWRLHQVRDEPEIFFDYRTSPDTPWAVKKAAIDRKTLPSPVWDILHGNSWGAKGTKLLSMAQVDACIMDYRLPTTEDAWEALRERFDIKAQGAALDRALGYARQDAKTGDNSVWSTVGRNDDGHYFVLQQDALPTGAEHEVLASAGRAHDLFEVTSPILEQFQAGDLASGGKIEGAELRAMTTPAKVTMYNKLYELASNGRLHFPAGCKDLRRELLSITVDTTHPQPRFEGKPHDDQVDALCWAITSCEDAAPEFTDVWCAVFGGDSDDEPQRGIIDGSSHGIDDGKKWWERL